MREWTAARTLKRYFCYRCGGRSKLLVKGFSYILLCETEGCRYINLHVKATNLMSKTFLGKLGEAPVVMPIGPVAYWWDTEDYKHWDLPEHWHYVAWRERVNDALVEHGCLVYRHWEAFKGTWNNKMQEHNNRILADADVLINLKPDYAWSEGTDEEVEYAASLDKPMILAPPPKTKEEFSWAIKNLLEEVDKILGLT